MPLPKRQHSHARTARRRAANFKLTLPNVQPCPRCHAPKLAHHVCPDCGFYNNRMVLDVQARRRRQETPEGEAPAQGAAATGE